MPFKIVRDPNAPAQSFRHPKSCMNCGHLPAPEGENNEAHDSEVGCLVTGGTKFLEGPDGTYGACSCLKYVAPPE